VIHTTRDSTSVIYVPLMSYVKAVQDMMVIHVDASSRYIFQDTEENKDFYSKIYNFFHIKTTQFHILAITGLLNPFSCRK